MCHGARTRDYFGTEEWLKDAGIINISYNLEELDKWFYGIIVNGKINYL